MKTCTKCGLEKDESEFRKQRRQCRDCIKIKSKEYNKRYWKENKKFLTEKSKKYHKENKEKLGDRYKEYREKNKKLLNENRRKKRQENLEYYREKDRRYYENNKEIKKHRSKDYRERNKEYYREHNKSYHKENAEKIKEQNKEYYEKNKEILKAKNKEYRMRNKDAINAKKREYQRKKLKTDINFKLKRLLRGRLKDALKNNQKTGSAVRDLGCTIRELKAYLEDKFQPGMSWDNWSVYGWHVDHIVPLSKFDLTNRVEFLKACHYTNLQPLWAVDNIKKSNKITN